MDDEILSKFIYPSHILSELLFWSPSLIHILKKYESEYKSIVFIPSAVYYLHTAMG